MKTDTKIHDGGPAFPYTVPGVQAFERGMSLRDYLAAKAMQGLMTGIAADGVSIEQIADETSRPEAMGHIAQSAYEMANAMIAARRASASPAEQTETEKVR